MTEERLGMESVVLATEVEGGEGVSAVKTKTSRYLSKEERRIATEMLLGGASIRAVSKKLHRALSSIHKVKCDLKQGLSWNVARTKTRKSKLDNDTCKRLIEDELEKNDGRITVAQIAKVLNCAPSTAHTWRKKQGFFKTWTKTLPKIGIHPV
ncbi:hypothetical protein HOP50_10g59070 [Chloropicon primus]|nr:hypothetical protein HOP50_10g59070 [Chloropicon primus]